MDRRQLRQAVYEQLESDTRPARQYAAYVMVAYGYSVSQAVTLAAAWWYPDGHL